MLETLIDNTISFPVGRVEYLYMYPVSFDEFLQANNEVTYTEAINQIPVPEYAHDVLMKLFSRYALIGGMPEIVANYLKYRDIVLLDEVYKSLITSYLDDVEKYANSNKSAKIIRFLIGKSFYEAGKRIKFSNFANSNYRADEIKEAFLILEKALLLNIIYPTTKVTPPIEVNFKKSPKLILLDTGLMNYFADHQKELFNSNDISSAYNGIIAEHIVAQELQAYKDNHLHKVHFWIREKTQSNAEVDFLLKYNNLLIPIEVKTGKTGRLRSLHQFIDKCPHNFAVRIYSGKYNIQKTKTISGKEYFLLNLPFFLISKIDKYIELMVK